MARASPAGADSPPSVVRLFYVSCSCPTAIGRELCVSESCDEMMDHAYIVKTPDGYLYPFAGDVSLTDDESQAGRFASTDEARKTAEERGYYDGRFEIMRIELGERNHQQRQ